MSKIPTTAELQAELDALIAWFESDTIDIDAAVKKYERGTHIIALLQQRLEQAELTINTLTKQL